MALLLCERKPVRRLAQAEHDFSIVRSDQAAFLKLDGTAEFEPMPGRKMKGYVVMADPLGRRHAILAEWMQRSLAFTGSLPPKVKKPAPLKKVKKAKR